MSRAELANIGPANAKAAKARVDRVFQVLLGLVAVGSAGGALSFYDGWNPSQTDATLGIAGGALCVAAVRLPPTCRKALTRP
jgi:hypothetical protein